MSQIKILGISGSLKATSSNTKLLTAISSFFDPKVTFDLLHGLDALPYFNPDREAGNAAVQVFKKSLGESRGVIICTPEYAFGVPGVLKNALDWTVHTGDLNDKPLMALSCSPLYEGGGKAMASLLLTLSALGAKMSSNSHLSIGDIYRKMDQAGAITDKDTHEVLRRMAHEFVLSLS